MQFVRYWHLADMTFCIAKCPLMTQGGHPPNSVPSLSIWPCWTYVQSIGQCSQNCATRNAAHRNIRVYDMSADHLQQVAAAVDAEPMKRNPIDVNNMTDREFALLRARLT